MQWRAGLRRLPRLPRCRPVGEGGGWRVVEGRKLGRSGVEVPVIGLGTWRRLEAAAAAGRHRELLASALAAGVRLVDTSPMYGGAERLLAEALHGNDDLDDRDSIGSRGGGRRGEVVVADKVWTRS